MSRTEEAAGRPEGEPEHPVSRTAVAAASRIGVDVGGTFTDVVVERDGVYLSTKVLTTHDAPERGILAGIEALTRAMALDLGPYNIRVNALMPGSIDTSGLPLEQRKLRGENVPLERIGEPFDMTGAALFLASDDAAYITGDIIRVDGGMLAQQRSATVDIMPPKDFPDVSTL